MRVKLNTRGQIFLASIVILTAFSVFYRSPTLILLSTLAVAYIISYPWYVRKIMKPNVELVMKFRHGILFRGEVEILQIKVNNHTNSLLPLLKLKIEIPPTLYIVDNPSTFFFSSEPNSTQSFNIPMLPTARGSYSLGPAILSIGDPFMLYEEEIARVDSIVLRVYPKRLGFKVPKSRSRKVFSRLIGLFSIKHKGYGTEFHSLRDYIRGDSSKIVDWPTTARRGKLISREFEDEQRLEVIVALASGTSSRGAKFDFSLGLTIDIFDGIVKENHPVGIVVFDDKIIHEFKPTMSQRKKMHIWASVYDMVPRDVYAEYQILSDWIDKNGKTGDLIIIVGDLSHDREKIFEVIRDIRLRGNHVIFIDIWGYKFSYADELSDAAMDHGASNYGVILSNIIGAGIEQDNIFSGMTMKQQIARYGGIYGYIKGPDDNIVNALERALFAFFGSKWK